MCVRVFVCLFVRCAAEVSHLIHLRHLIYGIPSHPIPNPRFHQLHLGCKFVLFLRLFAFCYITSFPICDWRFDGEFVCICIWIYMVGCYSTDVVEYEVNIEPHLHTVGTYRDKSPKLESYSHSKLITCIQLSLVS